jgi:hypothetical protein
MLCRELYHCTRYADKRFTVFTESAKAKATCAEAAALVRRAAAAADQEEQLRILPHVESHMYVVAVLSLDFVSARGMMEEHTSYSFIPLGLLLTSTVCCR